MCLQSADKTKYKMSQALSRDVCAFSGALTKIHVTFESLNESHWEVYIMTFSRHGRQKHKDADCKNIVPKPASLSLILQLICRLHQFPHIALRAWSCMWWCICQNFSSHGLACFTSPWRNWNTAASAHSQGLEVICVRYILPDIV